MENKISIPKPCHEDWNAMLPEEQGKFCLSCSKTVIDFSTWEPDDILSYLSNRKEERVCGRFKTTQVAEPLPPRADLIEQVIHTRMPLLRKIAAVIVLCFGLLQGGSAEAQHMIGKVRAPEPAAQVPVKVTPATDTVVVVDTVKFEPQIMGMIAMPPKDIKKSGTSKGKGTAKKKTKR